jgi:hypothetical protein
VKHYAPSKVTALKSRVRAALEKMEAFTGDGRHFVNYKTPTQRTSSEWTRSRYYITRAVVHAFVLIPRLIPRLNTKVRRFRLTDPACTAQTPNEFRICPRIVLSDGRYGGYSFERVHPF